MITIRNVSEGHKLKYGKGKQIYKIEINFKRITTFEHTFEDGLAVCLRKAAEAIERLKESEI